MLLLSDLLVVLTVISENCSSDLLILLLWQAAMFQVYFLFSVLEFYDLFSLSLTFAYIISAWLARWLDLNLNLLLRNV